MKNNRLHGKVLFTVGVHCQPQQSRFKTFTVDHTSLDSKHSPLLQIAIALQNQHSDVANDVTKWQPMLKQAVLKSARVLSRE